MKNKPEIYEIKDHTRDEISSVLSTMNGIFDKQLADPTKQLIYFNPNHSKNSILLSILGVKDSSVEDVTNTIISLFRELEVTNFCHSEIDRCFPTDKLFCFKRSIQLDPERLHAFSDELVNYSKLDEIYLKFKFKVLPNDTLIFAMSYHFPTKGYAEWTYLFEK